MLATLMCAELVAVHFGMKNAGVYEAMFKR